MTAPATPNLAVRTFVLGPFETNCYVLRTKGEKPCWIIDAGVSPGAMIKFIRDEGLSPELLILTHAHGDHIAGVSDVVNAFKGGRLPILIHAAEASWLSDPIKNLSAMGMGSVTAPDATRLLEDGEVLTLGTTSWKVLHTPGHSPGSISLYCAAAGVVFAGDALFAGSVGRTDFPGSDHETLMNAIRTKLYTLPDDTAVLPGHGPATQIGREKRTNPFVSG